jgi:AhpD family alkylhydroperoxidase
MSKVEEFNSYREKMNDRILGSENLVIKRFFNLDTNTYKEGSVPTRVKEMIGLAVSLGLRCDDCVKYHTQTCYEMGLSEEEFLEVVSIAMLIGGSITIPHLRRAVEFWDELKLQNK